jgi:two-component system sensor histidine kinase RegB
MDIRLPLLPLMVVPALLVVINLVSIPVMRRRKHFSNSELTAALLLDVAALGWQLNHSGGLENPFASLFLLQVALGAMILRPAAAWVVVATAMLVLGLLSIQPEPLGLPPEYAHQPLKLYLIGSLICFVLIAVLLVAFMTRINRNLRERDAALAISRQRAAEEDHIVRMGLLASGAAHELGTPLSTMSVLLGDWRRIPKLAKDADLSADLDDMDAAVKRCKTIVSGILMSAGEARGEAPKVTTMRAFLTGLVEEWQSIRTPGAIQLIDRFGNDVPIISDPALKQVLGNIIDNAADFSPDWVQITAMRDGDALLLEIADNGPGFMPEILETFGQPYRSSKGRPGGGLGLFLLVNVMRKLGGRAEASNRAEGGALVRVILPLDAIGYDKEQRP